MTAVRDVSQTVINEVTTLMKLHQGLHDAQTFEVTKARLGTALLEFKSAHDQVSVQHPPTTPEHVHWSNIEVFPVDYLLGGESTIRELTQPSMTAEYIASLQIVLQLPLSEMHIGNRYVYFVTVNHHHLHGFMQHSMDLRYDALQAQFMSYNIMVSRRPFHIGCC